MPSCHGKYKFWLLEVKYVNRSSWLSRGKLGFVSCDVHAKTFPKGTTTFCRPYAKCYVGHRDSRSYKDWILRLRKLRSTYLTMSSVKRWAHVPRRMSVRGRRCNEYKCMLWITRSHHLLYQTHTRSQLACEPSESTCIAPKDQSSVGCSFSWNIAELHNLCQDGEG